MNNQPTEITIKACLLGIILSMVLAGANAYLGLFAGMTVSASIPAAVISMGILSVFKKSNILENNIVQTAASAGESLAAGLIFSIPALLLIGYWQDFNYIAIAKIAAIGGVIGVLFTVPLRRALILEAKLLFPEGIATAEVLRTGEAARSVKIEGTPSTNGAADGLKLLSMAGITGAVMKLAQQGFTLWGSAIEGIRSFGGSIFGIGCDLSPALLSVGYIVGRNIAILVFAGGALSWLVAIPIYSYMHGWDGEVHSAAWNIWNTKIRYLGVGAMVVGGIWSLIKLAKPLIDGIRSSIRAYSQIGNNGAIPREERDFPIKYVFLALLALLIPVFCLYQDVIGSIPLAVLLSIVMLVFGFLFSAVASYMAGIVGSSNNPIVYSKDYEFKIGKSITLREGKDITIFSSGAMVYQSLEVAKILESKKISSKVVNMHTIKPIDKLAIEEACETKLIVSIEEHNVIGGLGSAISEYKSSLKQSPKQLFLGIKDTYSKGGNYKFLKEKHRLTPEKIVEDIVLNIK